MVNSIRLYLWTCARIVGSIPLWRRLIGWQLKRQNCTDGFHHATHRLIKMSKRMWLFPIAKHTLVLIHIVLWYNINPCLCEHNNSNGAFYTPVWKTGRIMPWQCPSVRPSVRVFPTFLHHALRYQFETWYIHSKGGTTCRVWVASQLGNFDLVYSPK